MPDPNQVFDVLIAGSGPAGLSIALGLSRVQRTAAIFTKPGGLGFRNEGASEMHNVLSRDKIAPEEFRKLSKQQILDYGTTSFIEAELVNFRTVKLESTGQDGFEVEDAHGRTWQGRKLALAMGSVEVFPDIQGYKENWPHNIYQCMFCDGHERKHLPGGVLGFSSPMSAHLAQMVNLLRTKESGPVTVFTDGVTRDTEGMADAFRTIDALGCKVETSKIIELQPANKGVDVVLGDGTTVAVGYLGHKPLTTLAGVELIKALGITIDDHPIFGQNIKTIDMVGSTNIKGIFAAGDCATPLKAAANAMSSGSTVAAGIVQQLIAEDLAVVLQAGTKEEQVVVQASA